MVHKAERRRYPDSQVLSWVLQRSTGLSLQLHFQNTMASLQPQLCRTVAMRGAILVEIPFSSHLNPDGSQHNLAAAQPGSPPPSSLNHPSARGRGPGHPSAGAPSRDLLHPEKTPLFPDSHTHTHTRQGKVNTAAASSHQIRAEHHSLIATA